VRAARSWLIAVAIVLTAVVIVVFLLAVPGCGSGSTGIGKL
jgi:hypothetical protein